MREIALSEILQQRGGEPLDQGQMDLRLGGDTISEKHVFYAGNLSNASAPSVAIVGTRNVSHEGASRARHLAKKLSRAGVGIVSGLAEGVDTEALSEAIRCGGKVAAVIGTPLDKAYPAKNAKLQEEIYRNHLLISQFPVGQKTYRSNFPERNRLMATITDATIVVEASDTSGTLHQSAECQRLGRWLFILKSVADNPYLTWPDRFRHYDRCVILERIDDVLERIL